MKKLLCYLVFMVNPLTSMDMEYFPKPIQTDQLKPVEIDDDSPVFGAHKKKVVEIEEVFVPIDPQERNIVLDINDPEVQEVIRKVVSASIKEAFHNKQLEKELANKKKCCNSSTKLKIALLTALSSTATAIITIALNNQ